VISAIGELDGIQYLRGIAAMMVLLFHVQVQLYRLGYDGAWPSGLLGGIDIFYVISGFIMWSTTIERAENGPLDFWRRRIVRIVPLYWIVTGFVVIVLLSAPHMTQSSRFDLSHVASSFLFVGHPHPLTGRVEPLLIPGWTLNHEMFFYLIFGLFLLVPARIRLVGMLSALAGLVVCGRLLAPPAQSVAAFYTSNMLLEFGFGVLLGALAVQGAGMKHARLAQGWVLLAIGAIMMAFPPVGHMLPGVVVRGLPAVMIVAGVLVVEAHRGLHRSRLLAGLGDASYSIYLSHMITLSASSQLWRAMGLPTDAVGLGVYVPVAALLALAGGWFLYVGVERPLSRRLRAPVRVRTQVASPEKSA